MTLSLTPRTRRARVRTAALGAAVLCVAMIPGAAQATLTSVSTTFEYGDGNLVHSSGVDWDNVADRTTGTEQFSGKNDNSFGQGTKEDSTSVSVVSGSIPPNKSDLSRFYVADEKIGTHNVLYLAWERTNTLGSANMDFEINHNTQVTNLSGTGAKTITRTAGDLLVRYDFSGGGTTPTLSLSKWLTAAHGDSVASCEASNALPCWGSSVDLSAAGFADGSINTVTVTDPIPDPDVSLPTATFGEAAVDLTAAGVFPEGTCEGFGSVFLKSRSSASFTAELKDFIAPAAVNISNCGTVRITKTDDTSAALGGAVFTLYQDNAPLGGSKGAEDTATSFTCTTDATTGICTMTVVPLGQYWAVETTTPDGYGTAAPKLVNVSAGGTVDVSFIDPRQFTVITIVCKNSDHSLYPSTVVLDGSSKTSIGTGDTGASLAAQLCGTSGLGGATYSPKGTGAYTGSVTIP